MKKTISTTLSGANIEKITAMLASTPAKLESLSKGLSDKQLQQPLGPGESSFTQDLAHLLNWETT